MAECSKLEKLLDELHDKQEVYWYIRSRSDEIRYGDHNTKYFHLKASQRKKKNEIKGLYGESGKWCADEDEVEAIIKGYY